jgi:hypothetical protein
MCPTHTAWPPRPCATSPSRDVRCPSNLPAHHSPLSHCQSGSVHQDRLPRLAHMTNLDRSCDAGSARHCSPMPEPISSRAFIRFPGHVASSTSTCERYTSCLEPMLPCTCALRQCSRHTHLCAKLVCRARIARPPVLVCRSASLHAHPSSTPVAHPPVSYDQCTVAPPPPGHGPWPLQVAPLACAACPSIFLSKTVTLLTLFLS